MMGFLSHPLYLRQILVPFPKCTFPPLPQFFFLFPRFFTILKNPFPVPSSSRYISSTPTPPLPLPIPSHYPWTISLVRGILVQFITRSPSLRSSRSTASLTSILHKPYTASIKLGLNLLLNFQQYIVIKEIFYPNIVKTIAVPNLF